jgi:hypothetical protein
MVQRLPGREVTMHFEILAEDISGKRALDILIPKIVGPDHTFRVHPYKGIGHIPKSMKVSPDPSKRILLANLPRLLGGYGKTFPNGRGATVIVVCDLDRKKPEVFSSELKKILDACNPRPKALFCLAIEESEAWFLGDLPAVKAAFPKAKDTILNSYENDSICGTWELLADAVYPGGAKALSKKGYQGAGEEKSRWAGEITPHMSITNNKSPSFCSFREELRAAVS